MNLYKQSGFTFIELIMAVLVGAILIGIAVPSFTTFTMNKRITTQTNDFISSLALARSEALKRVSRVTACRSSNGTSCANTGGWEQGWVVFEDENDNAMIDGNDMIIRVYSALESGNTLRGSSNVNGYISYVSSGNSKLISGAFQSGDLVLCDSRGAGAHSRVIGLSVTGQVSVKDTVADSCRTGS